MRRRGGAAGLVSGLAHLLAAGLLLILKGGTPSPDRLVVSAPIEVEITHQAGPTPRSRPLAPVGEPARIAGRPAPNRRDGAALPRHPEPDSLDRPEVDRPPAPGSAPDLSFWGLPPATQERFVGPPPEGVVRSRARVPSVDELRVLVERREDAVANVRAGRVDPVLYDYLSGARARFEDEARRLAGTITLDAGTSVGGWVRGYLQTVEDVHRLSAADEAPDLRDDAARRRPDLAAASDESLRQAETGAEERRAEVCLDVAPGRAPAVALRRGSGNAALDRVALDAFTRSAALRPVPDDARAGRACYEVRISAFRAPPGPFVTCGLGRAGVTCIWPFKRITSVTGRLLSVEYPPARNAPAVGSLLRAPR